MGKMIARVVLNPIAMQNLYNNMRKSAEQTAYALRTDVEDAAVVPFAVGTLQNTSYIDSTGKAQGIFKLVYSTPYARRLYWHPEYNFRTTENANARGEWLDPWINGNKRTFARKTFMTLLRRNAGLR